MFPGKLVLSTALTLAALVSTSCAQVTKETVTTKTTTVKDAKPVVILETSAGDITIELDPAKSPISVENFLKYVDKGYYDGLIFHRVIPGFMIQGGGIEEVNDKLKEKERAFPPIKNESRNGLKHLRGAVAMARTPNPNSATSQFFIDHADSPDLDSASGGYAVFGKVIDGMDVVDVIAKTKTTTKLDAVQKERDGTPVQHDDVPVKAIVIKSAKRKPKS